jgi:signal transduction histidine kinase/CheY-like chemotaxis protein
MSLIGLLSAASVAFALAAGGLLLVRRGGGFARDGLIALLALLVLVAARDVSNLLEWTGHDVGLDYLEDFVEVITPLLWIFLAYALLQQTARRDLRSEVRQRLQIEEQRQRLESEMQQAQRIESLGMLAGGIAHDFNNILLAILGHADLALHDLEEDSNIREDLNAIRVAAIRAADLCRQMLTYTGKANTNTRDVLVPELIRELTQMLAASLPKTVELQVQVDQSLPPVEADPGQLRQVVMNLLLNAAEALQGQAGRVCITAGCAESPREDSAPHAWIYLEVADTGRGMDEQTRSRMFDPFFTTKFTGRGLGLATVLGVVKSHRGDIQVNSQPGQGTTIRVLLPASAGNDNDGQVAGECRVDTWRGQGLVLLVDDEESGRIVARRMLERLGFEVVTARDGVEALESFQLHRGEVVCVLLDLTMPRMDGRTALRRLRKQQADLPILLMSGYDSDQVSQRLLESGPTAFLNKPFQLDQLQNELQTILAEDPDAAGRGPRG